MQKKRRGRPPKNPKPDIQETKLEMEDLDTVIPDQTESETKKETTSARGKATKILKLSKNHPLNQMKMGRYYIKNFAQEFELNQSEIKELFSPKGKAWFKECQTITKLDKERAKKSSIEANKLKAKKRERAEARAE